MKVLNDRFEVKADVCTFDFLNGSAQQLAE